MDAVEWFFGGIIALIVAGVIALVVWTIWFDNDQHARLHRAENRAAQRCAPFDVVTYDVQDQSRIVFACSNDGKLRVLNYGEGFSL